MATKSDPSLVADISNRNKILNLALQGLTVQGIVEETHLTEDTVRNTLSDLRSDLSIRLQEAQENWIALNMARTEKIISRVMPIFDVRSPDMADMSSDNQVKIANFVSLIGDAAKIFTNMAKLQKDMLQVKIEAPASSNPSLVQNNTFISNSDFYKEALQHIQVEKFGQTFDDYMDNANAVVDVIPTIQENDRLNLIEAKVDRLLPTNEPPTDPDDTP